MNKFHIDIKFIWIPSENSQMKQIVLVILTLALSFNGTSQKRLDISFPTKAAITIIQTKLNIPFGTIAKLKVEIYDGDNLKMKGYQDCYMLKVNSINGKVVKDTLLLKFVDDSKTLSNNDEDLCESTLGKSTDTITNKQFYEMKKKYVGERFTIMAYEIGQFIGVPEKYFDYKRIVPGIPHVFSNRGFFFEHSLIVVSKLTM